jgi:hypothetical protein
VAEVPVRLDDNGEIFDTVMVAGLVGSRLTSSKGPYANAPDTLSPVAGWWMYIRKTNGEIRRQAEPDMRSMLDSPQSLNSVHSRSEIAQGTSVASHASSLLVAGNGLTQRVT